MHGESGQRGGKGRHEIHEKVRVVNAYENNENTIIPFGFEPDESGDLKLAMASYCSLTEKNQRKRKSWKEDTVQ